ncbi:recombinase family protein [Amycolatopsis plumensis]|uniref:Recombinase family protein n=1 Tax=Amycolatopsis plumensis TaxID=236508 RepID=A0ABV5UCI9_9PSEU
MRPAKKQLIDAVTPVPKRGNRVVIYARVSVDRGKSTEGQVSECRAWAEREGYVVVAVIVESGSASRHAKKARKRWPEVAQLIADGQVDMLMTVEFSRATRELEFYAGLRNACADARVLWWYGGTIFDMSKREDRFRTGLDALRAEDEADQISERAARGHRGGAARGRPPVGSAPWGYRRVYDERTGVLAGQEPDPVTAPLVREVADRIVAGETVYAVIRDLNAREVPTPRGGKQWHNATLKQALTRPALAGLRVHQGAVVGEGDWKPLLTIDEHHQLVERLNDPAKRQQRDGAIKHLLTGLARCAVCEASLRFLPHKTGPKYQCSGKYCVMRGEAFVDSIVRLAVIKRMDREDASRLYLRDTSDEARRARDHLAMLKLQMEQYYQQAESDDEDERLSPAGLARMERKYLPQIEQAERQLAAVRTAQSPLITRLVEGDAASVWDDELSVAQRREVVRSIITVHLDRAATRSRPDPRSVRIEFTSSAAAS